MVRTRVLPIVIALAAWGSVANAQAPRPLDQRTTADNRAVNGQGLTTADRWSSWLGCWVPAGRTAADAGTQVCMVPTQDGQGVRVLTFAGDRELLAESIVADGSRQPASEKDCSGERTSHWAQSGPRFFSASTLTCAAQPAVRTSGISTLVPSDRWVDVQVIDSGGRVQVRTRRFLRSSDTPPAPVADIVRQFPPARRVVADVSADDVIEASHEVAAEGVEAWLAETGARVPIDRRSLLRLSDAQVGANVIDLLVALAFPRKFEVRRASSGGGGGGFSGGSMADGYFPGEWGYLADVYGLGFGSFGMPYFLGYNGYYGPGAIYYVPGGGGAAEDTTHGQVVNGQGYTRVQPREPYRGTATRQAGGSQSGAGGGAGADNSGATSDNGSAGGSSSSGATPSGYSGGGGTSTGLSAVPR